MKVLAENTIKKISVSSQYVLAIKIGWYWNIPTPAFMPLQYPVGGDG
jgi:hypothetical protein